MPAISSATCSISHGRHAEEFTDLEINKFLNDTLQLLEPQLRKSSVEIVKDYDEQIPAITGSGGKLQQVFTNLILNARDAMISGGTITLKTFFENDDRVIVQVIDTGEGIPAENLKKVFDPVLYDQGRRQRNGPRAGCVVRNYSGARRFDRGTKPEW